MKGCMDIKTSIVILTFNKLEYTIACIDSIREYTRRGTYEIIVIDNASTDGTRDWLAQQTDIVTIFNEENLGFPKGCNQGIQIATGSNILLLNNDVIVTEHWLDNLLEALYSSEEIGAVGAISNNCPYYQAIPVDYKTLDEMHSFARALNVHDPKKWEERIKLVGFCMLIKREVVDKVGSLDERFTPGNYEDDDYSFRILQAGYRLLLCKDVFIHHVGHGTFKDLKSEFDSIMRTSRSKFIEKWGFNSDYSTFIRSDVTMLMDDHPTNEAIRVLEVGCACGATLLDVKNRFNNAQLYGIEINSASAAISSLFAEVSASNVENDLDYEEEFFDYILLPDVLEHLQEPWGVLSRLKKYLKNNGKILASLPNVNHFTVIRDMLRGRWEYTDAGLLDRTHLRFFTLKEIEDMFLNAGFHDLQYNVKKLHEQPEDEEWINNLAKISDPSIAFQLRVYQYLIRGVKKEHLAELTQAVTEVGEGSSESIVSIGNMLMNNDSILEDTLQIIEQHTAHPEDTYNSLAIHLYQQQHYNHIIPLLSKAFDLNPHHQDTLYNLGYFLYLANENDLALSYLERIEIKDQDVLELISKVSI